MPEKKHSKFAPSSAHRWLKCHGSIRLSQKAPPQKVTKYAIEGTRAHECLEFLVRRRGSIKKAEKEALKKWDADMVRHGLKAVELIYSIRPTPQATLVIEHRAVVHNVTKKLYGHLDYAWIDEWGLLVVIDYKYGQGVPVFPYDEETQEENPQLMIYASGIAQVYDYEFDRIQLAIIQPRVWSEEESPLTTYTTTIKRLRDFEETLRTGIKLTQDPNAPLKAGEWCQFCAAIPICPEISHVQLQKADIVFDVDNGIKAAPDPKGLTVETLPKVLDACDLLEDWIRGVREHAFNLAETGKKIPGRKLVQKRASRIWLPGAEKAAKRKFGDDVFQKEFLSPSQLEKVFGKNSVKAFVDKYTSSVSSGFSLVRESDKRLETSSIAFDLDNEK